MYNERVCKHLQHCLGYKEQQMNQNLSGNDLSLNFRTVDFVSLSSYQIAGIRNP